MLRPEKATRAATLILTLALLGTMGSGCARFSGIGFPLYFLLNQSTVGAISVTESGGSTSVSESSGYDFYSVALDSEPTEDVTVSIAFDSTQTRVNNQSTSPQQLTFTSSNWSAAQVVIVRAVDDTTVEGNHTSSITHTVSSSDSRFSTSTAAAVTAQISDNDSSGVSIFESGGTTAATEGGSGDSYDVVLNKAPTATVTASLSFDDTQLRVNGSASPVAFTFTTANWYTPQTATVTALNDGTVEGPHSAAIAHSASSTDTDYNGISIPSVSVDVTDANGPGVSIVESSGSTSVSESGTSDSYDVVLMAAPTGSVTVRISFDTAQLRVNGSSTSPVDLTFTTGNWATTQTVTVSAVDDSTIEGVHSGLIAHTVISADGSYNGMTVRSIIASIVDNDVSPVVSGGVQTGQVTLNAGTTSANVTVTSVDTTKSFVMCYFTSVESENNHVATCELANSTTVTISNGGGSFGTVVVRWYLMEFGNGATVQRGSVDFASGDATQNVTISSVDASKAFAIVYARTPSTSQDNDERRLVRAELTSSTNLRLTRGETGMAITTVWQVVELDGARVQSGTVSITDTGTSVVAPLGIFDTSSAFLISSHSAGNLAGQERDYMVTGNITTSSSLTFERQGTVSQIDVAYYLVEMVNGPSIQKGSINVTIGNLTGNATLSPTVGTSPLFTLPLITNNVGGAGNTNLDAGYFRPTIPASNTLTVTRIQNDQLCRVDWYAITLTSQ